MTRSLPAALSALIALILFISACGETASTSTTESGEAEASAAATLPDLLRKGLEAHGGLDRWRSMKTMQFTVERMEKPEHHLIDLGTRQVLLTHDNYQVGFDGHEVWVAPDKAAFGDGSARFYHNLRFYFIAMPFIVADPGINYELLPQRQLQGKTYDVLRVTYEAGVGDAPEDEYLLYFDPETHQMEWLFYTVTYYSGQAGDKYNVLHYPEWQTVNGLRMPQKMIGYTYENGAIGEQRYERLVRDLQLSADQTEPSVFVMPAEAEIDSLIVH